VSEDFLRRWARLKRASNTAPAKRDVSETAPQLPAIDSLSFESEFKDFMHSKVEESVKRAALKKLFADPRFNVMDGLDTYIDDYSKEDPISEELLAQLQHAKQALFVPKEKEEEEKPVVAEEGQEKPNVDPAQNT
jgi:hypothetical protein